MLHGHIETIEERVDHLDRLRLLQDETAASRRTSRSRSTPENSEMSHVPGPTATRRAARDRGRALMLDNIRT
jgi:2-iminoacetate synthase ThiH